MQTETKFCEVCSFDSFFIYLVHIKPEYALFIYHLDVEYSKVDCI